MSGTARAAGGTGSRVVDDLEGAERARLGAHLVPGSQRLQEAHGAVEQGHGAPIRHRGVTADQGRRTPACALARAAASPRRQRPPRRPRNANPLSAPTRPARCLVRFVPSRHGVYLSPSPAAAKGVRRKGRPSSQEASSSASTSSGRSSCRCGRNRGRAGDVVCLLAPRGEHVVGLAHGTLRAPEGEERHRDAPVRIGGIVVEVDPGGGAVILADRVAAGRIRVTPQIFRVEIRRGRAWRLRLVLDVVAQEIVRIGADKTLGQGAGWMKKNHQK